MEPPPPMILVDSIRGFSMIIKSVRLIGCKAALSLSSVSILVPRLARKKNLKMAPGGPAGLGSILGHRKNDFDFLRAGSGRHGFLNI